MLSLSFSQHSHFFPHSDHGMQNIQRSKQVIYTPNRTISIIQSKCLNHLHLILFDLYEVF